MSKTLTTRLVRFITILILLGLALLAGYLIAKKDNFSTTNNNLVSKAANGFVENSLTQIKELPIYGVFGAKKGQYGQLLYKVVSPKHTEILLQIENVPLQIKSLSDTNKIQSTPDSLKLYIAKICCGSLDYEYQDTNALVNFEVKNGAKFSTFSTVLDLDLNSASLDRLVLNGDPANLFSIQKDGQKDWPRKVTEKSAPYLWVDL